MPILIRFLVSLYWSGSKAADRTLFGGFRKTAAGAWLAAYVVTDWDDIGPGQGWKCALVGVLYRTKPISYNPFRFKVSGRFSQRWMGSPQGFWGGRRFCDFWQGHAGCSQSQESMGRGGGGHTTRASYSGIGGNFVALRVNGHGQGALARWRTQDGCFGFRERGLGRVGRFGSRGQHRRTRGLEPAYRPDPADCPERRSTSGWPTIRTESRHPLQKHCVTGQVTKSRGRAVGSIIQMAVDFISSAPPAS